MIVLIVIEPWAHATLWIVFEGFFASMVYVGLSYPREPYAHIFRNGPYINRLRPLELEVHALMKGYWMVLGSLGLP